MKLNIQERFKGYEDYEEYDKKIKMKSKIIKTLDNRIEYETEFLEDFENFEKKYKNEFENLQENVAPIINYCKNEINNLKKNQEELINDILK